MANENRSGAPAAALMPERMFLTAGEVGQQLGLRRSRVYELAAAGQLPVVRLGKRMLFPRRGLDELAEEAIARARAEMQSTRSTSAWPADTRQRERRSA